MSKRTDVELVGEVFQTVKNRCQQNSIRLCTLVYETLNDIPGTLPLNLRNILMTNIRETKKRYQGQQDE